MMKKGLTLLVTSMFVCSACTAAFAVNFSDVNANYSWAQDAIATLAEEKVIEGYPDGTFQPGKNIT